MPVDTSWLDEGLIIDNFAGGGGASTGIEMALGRSPDVAINHDAEAVALHAANHPDTLHLCQNVWKADPREVVRQASARRCALLGIPARDLPVRFAWFSPDCKQAAILSHAYSSNTAGGSGNPGQPAKTITTGGHHALVECDLSAADMEGAERVAAFIAKYYSAAEHGQSLHDPLHTVTAKPRFALVTVNGWPIVDIGLRMLQPRELYHAQGFPADYVIDGPAPNAIRLMARQVSSGIAGSTAGPDRSPI